MANKWVNPEWGHNCLLNNTGLDTMLNYIKQSRLRIVVLTILCVTASMVTGATYLSPVDVCASPDGQTLYVAELTAGQVAVFDAVSGTVTGEIVLADPNQASGVAVSSDGATLYVTAADPEGQVYVINTASNSIVDMIAVGHTPLSPVLSPDGSTLYVCNRFDNSVSAIDLATNAETIIPVTREPVSAAVTPDGSKLIVSNFLPTDAATSRDISVKMSIVETSSNTVSAAIRLPNGSVSARGVCVSPDGQYAYVVHLLAKYHVAPNQVERGWTFNNMLSIIDLNGPTLLSSVILDDLDLGAANPSDVQCTADGALLVVAHAGTHEISVIDRAELHATVSGKTIEETVKDFSLLVLNRKRITLKGKGPRAIALVGSKAYAAEYFTGSLGIVDADPSVRPKALSVSLGSEPARTLERQGELIYHDATLSFQNWLSCSSCHPDARNDALNWDELNDGFGNAKQTKSHLYSHMTAPTTITGCRPNAETSVRAGLKYAYFNTIDESDAVAVDEYLKALTPVASPYLVNGQLSAAAARGKLLFEGAANCAACHSGTYFTDQKLYDVGTGFGRHAGTTFDTPTLAEIWRTAPYLYRGQEKTIRDVLTTYNPNNRHGNTTDLTSQEIADLAEYVLSIGTE